MGAVVISVAAGVAGGVAAKSAITGISIALTTLSLATSRKAAKEAKKALSEGTPASERKQMLRASNGPMVGILGRSEISGTLFFAEEVKSESQLHLCVALCGHSLDEGEPVIAGCHRIMMDDVEVPQGESHSGRVYMRVYDGRQTTIDDIEPRLRDCYSWQDDMVGKGICFAHIHLKYHADTFPNGIPNFKFLLDTVNPVIEHYDDWEQALEPLNSADALEYYLRHVFDADDSEINTTMFDQARALCDETVTNSEGEPEPRYTCNGCWDFSESHRSVINKILQTCAGQLEYVDGQFGLRPGAYLGPPDFTLTTDDIIGDITVQPMPERQDLGNVITGTHVNPLFSYQTVDFPEVRSDEFIEQDGEKLNEDFNLEYVHSTYQAQRLASIQLNRSRLGVVNVPTNLRGYECSLGRNIRLNAPVLGYDNMEFVVEGWEFSHDKGVTLVLRQDYPELWDDYIGKAPTPPPDTSLPNPRECLPVENLRYSERQVNNIWESRLDWTHPAPGGIIEYIVRVYQGNEIAPEYIIAEYTTREPRCLFELPESDAHRAEVLAVNTFSVHSEPVRIAFFVSIPEVVVIGVLVKPIDNSVYPCRAYCQWQTVGDDSYPPETVQYECELNHEHSEWLPAGSGFAKSRWLEGLDSGDYEVRVRAKTPLGTSSAWQSTRFAVYIAEQPQNLMFTEMESPTYWGKVTWTGAGVNWELELLIHDTIVFTTSITHREVFLEWHPPGDYVIRVRAFAGQSQSDWASIEAMVLALQKPSELSFDLQDDNAAAAGVLTWVINDRRTEFHEVEVLKDGERVYAATDSGNFQTIPALVPANYLGRVRTMWRQSSSAWATTAIRITESVQPPADLDITPPTDTSYQGTLNWSGLANSFAVRIRRGGETIIDTSVLGNNYRIPLLPVATYAADVRAQGTFSDSAWVSTPLEVSPPAPPTELTFTETPDNAASYGTLNWQPSPSAGVSGYLVSILDSDDADIVTTQTVTTRHPVGNLPVGGYRARVRSLSVQGGSESSPAGIEFAVSSLASPRNLSYEESLVETGTGLTTQVVFRWEAGDSRTHNYDVEYRDVENAIWSGLYSGPSATATVSGLAPGDYWFRVRGLSYADSSGWSQLGVHVRGFNQPPDDIGNLQLRALGGQQALLTWDPIQSPDVVNGGSVHVRHTYLIGPGAVWEAAVPLTQRLPGNTTFFSVPLLSGTYLLKAVNGNGYWSEQAASVVSTMGNLLGYNRVVEREEPTDWPGEKNKATVDSGGSISFAEDNSNEEPPYYIMDEPLDLGALLTVRLYLECDGSVYEVDTIDERTNPIDDWPMFDGVEPGGTALQYHVSQTDDDPDSNEAEWSDWTQFLVGEFRARAFRLRISLITESPIAAGTVSNLKLIADVPDRSEAGRGIDAPADGLPVQYDTPFLAPAVIGITLHGGKTGDYWDFTSSNENGFTVQFYNSSGEGIAANFDYLATSYGEQS